MGDIVNAKCECGFEEDCLSIGCGMSMTYYAPAVCLPCGILVTKSYYAKDGNSARRYSCKLCHARLHFLNEPGFFSPPDLASQFPDSDPWDITHVSSGETGRESYPEVRYTCPKCHKMTLALEDGGCWD